MSEHRNQTNRRLHFVGTSLSLAFIIFNLYIQNYSALWLVLVIGYGFAWVGHFFIEKNRPATFRHPLWSLRGDFRLFFRVLTGKMKF